METLDISQFLVSKSDQINADDLTGGPIVVQILDVTIHGGTEQPVTIRISGGHKPWKPCKTVLRVLAFGWETTNAATYIGKWVRLFRDPTAKWAGVEVGGIRVSGMSDIKGAFTVTLAETKGGKKTTHKVALITAPTGNAQPTQRPTTATKPRTRPARPDWSLGTPPDGDWEPLAMLAGSWVLAWCPKGATEIGDYANSDDHVIDWPFGPNDSALPADLVGLGFRVL